MTTFIKKEVSLDDEYVKKYTAYLKNKINLVGVKKTKVDFQNAFLESLDDDMKVEESETETNISQCYRGDKEFSSGLDKIRQSHKETKPFKCEWCDKGIFSIQ